MSTIVYLPWSVDVINSSIAAKYRMCSAVELRTRELFAYIAVNSNYRRRLRIYTTPVQNEHRYIKVVDKTHTHTHTQPFYAPLSGLPGWAGARRNLLLDFLVQGEISEADTPTVWLGATPSGLTSDPPPSSPIFTPDALPALTVPIYPGLGQAPNMVACIPSGLVDKT